MSGGARSFKEFTAKLRGGFMFPGMGGITPKQMEKMMKQMGIHQEEIDTSRVIFELADGRKWVINNPSVQKIEMMGKETFQVAGEVEELQEDTAPSFSEEDIALVVEQTGASREEAEKALKETGDIAEAIMTLKK